MFKSSQEIVRSFLVLLSFNSLVFPQEDRSLVSIRNLAPGIVVEMRYATENNFTKTRLYPLQDECLLCRPVAERLARVQKNLEKRGFGLKVWDCYRPLHVQKKLWEILPDPRFVADPKTGSRHNRGASIDLTLVDSNGNELLMPTGFDEFSEKARRNYRHLPAEALKNRSILEEAMTFEGFLPLSTEWWHFDAPDWASYELRDEPLGSASFKEDVMVVGMIPKNAHQLMVVTAPDWSSQTGLLQRYERTEAFPWQKVGNAWSVSLGLKGLAWGRGQQEPMREELQKREGDNKAPAGIFKVGQAYGYSLKALSGSRWPYTPVDETWRCVDDPASPHYNQIFPVTPATQKDWKSAELMKRSDHLYKWVINVEQNTPNISGCGSCIFLHVWRKPGSGTEGCTAMEEDHMVELLGWLDPALNPLLVQLPEKEYQHLKSTWQLP
ncbi:MAG: D-alanyl-D-alanine dipeptidase [Elusimicrobia bacterium]|nr:D-alanyl-D-alanine dipeptidase [Elusimicrobiota bacterium]